MMSGLRLRPTVRLLVIDDAERVLLFGGNEPDCPGMFWFTPGGGIDPGETHEQAARREMLEETGLSGFELGPAVWQRTGPGLLERETVMYQSTAYLVRVPGFDVDIAGFTEVERNSIVAFRWWTLDELRATSDRLVPECLPDIAELVLSDRWDGRVLDLSPPA